MEIRVLRYFVEVSRQKSITRAAAALHISQPTLSKQLKDLEAELGKKLFVRSSHNIHLTDEGMLLRRRAEDILAMVDKTAEEFQSLTDITGGDIYIAAAESKLVKYFADAIAVFRKDYPGLRFHILSSGTEIVTEQLDKGLVDLAVIVEPPDLAHYNYLEIPGCDTWGLLMRKDHPLAEKSAVTVEDLAGMDLICSEQSIQNDIPRWCGQKADSLHFVGTTNLFFNGSVFVREGLGCMLVFDGLADTGEGSDLVFRPLWPPLENKMYVIWRKYQAFTPIAERFIQSLVERP